MKPIEIKNDCGEIIEVKFDSDGVIQIRHSDIDPKSWAVLHEYSKRMRQPEIKAALETNKIFDTPEAKEMAERLGGYVVLNGDTHIVGADEVALIHEAVRKAGGIVPNWSNQP
jgi:hypothetical protein